MFKLILTALLLCAGNARAENLSSLITDARVLARDASSSTRQRFTDAQITELLNQGQREAIAGTHCIVLSTQFQLSPGTTYYPLPSNFTSVTRVTRSKYGAMTEKSPAALDGQSRGWELAGGTPTYYFLNFSSRGLVGFATWPVTSSDTDTIKVEYYAQANDLANSTDIPFNGIGELYDYHHALPYFAAAVMSSVDSLFTQSTGFMTLYSSVITTMKSRCLERVNYSPSAVAVP